MRALLTVTFLFATLPALADIRCERFELRADLKGAQLHLALDTDLPDYTDVMVAISRSYWTSKPSDSYPIPYYGKKEKVGAYRKPRTITLNDQRWRAEFNDRLHLLARADGPQKISRIADDIVVSFTIPVNQTERSKFGRANEKLVGSPVAKTGLRVIVREVRITEPLAADRSIPTFGDRSDLRVGTSYAVTRPSGIFALQEPPISGDKLANIVRMESSEKAIPLGAAMEVMQVRRLGGDKVWYQVHATARDGSDLGEGWIHSSALMGQELPIVKR